MLCTPTHFSWIVSTRLSVKEELYVKTSDTVSWLSRADPFLHDEQHKQIFPDRLSKVQYVIRKQFPRLTILLFWKVKARHHFPVLLCIPCILCLCVGAFYSVLFHRPWQRVKKRYSLHKAWITISRCKYWSVDNIVPVQLNHCGRSTSIFILTAKTQIAPLHKAAVFTRKIIFKQGCHVDRLSVMVMRVCCGDDDVLWPGVPASAGPIWTWHGHGGLAPQPICIFWSSTVNHHPIPSLIYNDTLSHCNLFSPSLIPLSINFW